MGRLRTSQQRADAAFALVQRQRQFVGTTAVGSSAHRQASEVLALIEESYFLLSELDRMAAPPSEAEPARAAASEVGPREPRSNIKASELGNEPTRS